MDRSRRNDHVEFGAAAGDVNRPSPSLAKLLFYVLLPIGSWAHGSHAPEPPRSGYAYLSQETRRLQDDLFANPGMHWVQKGQKPWTHLVAPTPLPRQPSPRHAPLPLPPLSTTSPAH